jgi:hypothetical protein
MTKKGGIFGLLPRVAAASQPDPGLSSAALSGLQYGGKILSTKHICYVNIFGGLIAKSCVGQVNLTQ